jgi:hypothetical protein
MASHVTPVDLRHAITEALWENVKAYDLAEFCELLGLVRQSEIVIYAESACP